MIGEAKIDPARLELPRRVHACVACDWLVFLDLAQDRYFAVPSTETSANIQATLRSKCPDNVSRERYDTRDSWLDIALRFGPDLVVVAEACWWASSIVSRRRLDRAFDWIESQKRTVRPPPARTLTSAHERFERLRAWVPHRYVCLFNSLALIRFLTRRGFDGALVFGVRGMPFAAHCWVEAGGAILDPGEEDCAAFQEIARV